MRPWMRREDRRVVAVLGFLHGVVHANILSIPIFLLAWKLEFGADDVTLGLLAAAGFGFYGLGAVPFGFLADRRPAGGLLLLCAAGIATSMVGVGASPSIPVLALSLGALGLFSGIYHPTGLSIISGVVAEQGRGMGWHGMGGSLGIAAGPAFVGAMLAIGWAWRAPAPLPVLPRLVALLPPVLPPGGAFTTAALLFGFLLFSLEPLQNILVTGEVPGPLRGLAFGFTFLSVFGIGSLGAALAGWLIANHASAILFLVLGGFLAASGTASLGVRLRVRPDDLDDRLHAPGHVRADLHLRLKQDDIEGRDEGPRQVDRIVFEAVDHRLDIIRVERRVRGLAGGHGLEHDERLGSTDFSDHHVLGALTEGRCEKVEHVDLACGLPRGSDPAAEPGAGEERDPVLVGQVQFPRVLDGHDLHLGRDEQEDRVQRRGLPGGGAAADEHRLPVLD